MDELIITKISGLFTITLFCFFTFNWIRIFVFRNIISGSKKRIDDEIYFSFHGFLSSLSSLYYVFNFKSIEIIFDESHTRSLRLTTRILSVLTLMFLVSFLLSFFVIMTVLFVRDFL
jgi:hypothetical protein